MSQFELHIKAITKDKIKTPKIIKKGLMRNLIGNEIKRTKQICKLKSYNVYKKKKSYDYGKKAIKQGRKMGHINFVMQIKSFSFMWTSLNPSAKNPQILTCS